MAPFLSKSRSKEPFKRAVQKSRSREPFKRAVQESRSREPFKRAVQKSRSKKPFKRAAQKSRSKEPFKRAVQKSRSKEPLKRAVLFLSGGGDHLLILALQMLHSALPLPMFLLKCIQMLLHFHVWLHVVYLYHLL